MRKYLAKLPIRNKLNVALIVSTLTAVAFLFAVMVLTNAVNLRDGFNTQIETVADVVAKNSAAALLFDDRRSATETLSALRVKPEIVIAEIHDEKGILFARYRSSGTGPDPSTDGTYGNHLWNRYVAFSRPISIDAERVGEVRIVADGSGILLTLGAQVLALAVATAVSLALAGYIATRFGKLIARPIQDVAEAAKAIVRDEDFSRQVARSGEDEVGQLIEAFNAMLGHIGRRDARLRDELDHRKRAEAELEHLAHYDHLTNLPNRYLFQQTLRFTLERARHLGHRVGLLFVDVDNFKVVNDSLGHATGDLLLQIVSQRLTGTLRANDIVSRVGGDEFTIIVENVAETSQLRDIADKLLAAFEKPMRVRQLELYATVSIGIALSPDDTTDGEVLVKYGDAAMYSAKRQGRANYQFFSAEMNDQINRRLTMESRLRKAIERNELFVVYQPQVHLASGEIVGCEALLRWRNPDLGLVSPMEFIPVAEECGFIGSIGQFVLEEACRTAAAWQAESGVPVRLAVNVSIRQFRARDFIANVQQVVDQSHIVPGTLDLELTESCIMENVEDTLAKVAALKQMGIRLSIDDFGTGYSSMTYLKQFPASQLKVDQSFVRHVPDSHEDVAIVRTVLQLSHGLRLESLAEGIETIEQARFLTGEGCMVGQGYYFSRPIPAPEFARLLESRKRYAN